MVEKSFFLNIFMDQAERRVGGKEIVKAFVSLPIISKKVETFYHKTNSFVCNLLD